MLPASAVPASAVRSRNASTLHSPVRRKEGRTAGAEPGFVLSRLQ